MSLSHSRVAVHRSDARRQQRGSRRRELLTSLLVGLLSLALVAPASARRPRPYRGKSAQGLAVRLGRTASTVRTFVYQATMRCSDGTTFTDGAFYDDVRIRRGRFRDRYTSDRGAVRNTLSGVVRGKRASGRLRVIERYGALPDALGNSPLDPAGPIVCDSGTVKWRAHT